MSDTPHIPLHDLVPLSVERWQEKFGGHPGLPHRHALKLLGEAIELCIACGAPAEEIFSTVDEQMHNEGMKGKIGRPIDISAVAEELADVKILNISLAYHLGIDTDMHAVIKLRELMTRQWEVGSDGVLRKPGRKLT